MTKKITPKERKEATARLKLHHEDTFKKLNLEDPAYIPKMAYVPAELSGLHIGFFTSELEGGVDVYTEKVSRYMESEDPSRTLYKWKYNPHFKSEYASEAITGGSIRHFIPLDELEIVDINQFDVEKISTAILDVELNKEVTQDGQYWLEKIAKALERIAIKLENTNKL
jgi:hypothetical protein